MKKNLLTVEHARAILDHFNKRIECAMAGRKMTREDISEADLATLNSAESILTGDGPRRKKPAMTEAASSFLKKYHSELGEDGSEDESEGYDRNTNAIGDKFPLGDSDPHGHQEGPRNLAGKKESSKRVRRAVAAFHRSFTESDRAALPNSWLG